MSETASQMERLRMSMSQSSSKRGDNPNVGIISDGMQGED